jgi:very-short-patch-repair endonuclease
MNKRQILRQVLKKRCKKCHCIIDDRNKRGFCVKHTNFSRERNSFWGMKHSKKTKNIMKQHHQDFHGENNPFFGKKHTRKSINKMRKSHKSNWLKYDTKKRNKILYNLITSSRKTRGTKIEKIISNFLNILNIKHRRHVQMGLYNVDFLVDKKFIIECFGDYWHFNPKFFNSNNKIKNKHKKDKIKKEILIKKGYKYLVLWEYDINNQFDVVRNKIRSFLNVKNTI